MWVSADVVWFNWLLTVWPSGLEDLHSKWNLFELVLK